METLTVTTDIATCEVFALSGPAKIKADDLTGSELVTLYEERIDGDYDPVLIDGYQVHLTSTNPSRIVEGYGNYKCLGSTNDLVVGYEN